MAGGLVYTAVGSEAMATAEYYGKAMCDLGKEHPEIVALTADLAGSTKIGVFRKEFAFEKWNDFDQELFDRIYNDDSQEREFTHKILSLIHI